MSATSSSFMDWYLTDRIRSRPTKKVSVRTEAMATYMNSLETGRKTPPVQDDGDGAYQVFAPHKRRMKQTRRVYN